MLRPLTALAFTPRNFGIYHVKLEILNCIMVLSDLCRQLLNPNAWRGHPCVFSCTNSDVDSRWRNNLLCSGTKLVYHVPEQGFFTTFQYKTTGWPTHTVHFDLSPSFFVRFWHIIYQNARIDPPGNNKWTMVHLGGV